MSIESAREERLLEAHRAGVAGALEELLMLMQPRLMAICFRMSRDAEHARDLCQDAIVRIIRGLPGFSGRSRLSTWMIRITMNVCLTDRRRSTFRRAASLDWPAGGADGGRAAGAALEDRRELSPGSRVEQGEELRRLSDALALLEPESRALLILRDAQGLDYSDIAEIIGVPIGTVKSRIFRARAALREEMEGRSKLAP